MKIFLFDLMDTLVIEPYHAIDAKLAQQKISQDWLKENLQAEAWQALKLQVSGESITLREIFYFFKNRGKFHEFERNRISEEDFFRDFYIEETPEIFRLMLPRPAEIKHRLLRKIQSMPGMLDRLIPALLAHAKEKPQDIYLGVASNYSVWSREIIRQFPNLHDLDFLFFSYELGFRKPEAEFYQFIMDRLHSDLGLGLASGKSVFRPQDILFVDDRLSNVEGAQSCGWSTFHFHVRDIDKLFLLVEKFLGYPMQV